MVYFCSLAVASHAGVFSRIYLTQLVHWDSVPLFSSLYPQMVGTAIMGFVTSHKKQLKNTFLYQALATGLCGSITSFSSWNQEAVSLLLQDGEEPPNRVFGWMTTLLLGFGMSAGALVLGQHLASLSPWADAKQQSRMQQSTANFSRCHIVEGNVLHMHVAYCNRVNSHIALPVWEKGSCNHCFAGSHWSIPTVASLSSEFLRLSKF